MKLNETVLEVMRHVRNFFHFDESKNEEFCKIMVKSESGYIKLDGDFMSGDWILVTGSRRYDGVYLLKECMESVGDTGGLFQLSNGTDETNPLEGVATFEGVVYLLLPRAGFILLCLEINEYMNNPDNFASSKAGENVIGFYSWTRATSEKGMPLTVFQVFASRLEPFRRMFSGLEGICGN